MNEALLLIPGLGCDERLYAHQLAHLGDVVELRFAGVPEAPAVAEMAGTILADAPARFALAGLSMGGYVAMEILRQAPTRVSRLALLDTKATLDPPEVTATRQAAIADIEQGRLAEHIETRLQALLGPGAFADDALKQLTRDMALTVGGARYANQQRAIMGRPDSRATLAAVACPALVLCGRHDALTPPTEHEAMAAAIPGGRFAVVEDAGHLSTIEQPVAVTAMLRDWLLYPR